MKLIVEIPNYDPQVGVNATWEAGFEIKASVDSENTVMITANKAGLLSLAWHLLALSHDDVPNGCHFHFDEHNSLEAGSLEFIIQKL